MKTPTHEHRYGRGVARVIACTDERVIYHSKDEQGEQTQHNGMRALVDFERDWKEIEE